MISYFRSTSNGDFLMVGLSTDTKPITNIPNGARFLEMDTSKQYYFDESTLTYIEQASSSGNVFHGTIHVTENGEYSVYGYAAADVNVAEPTGTIEIDENGEYDVAQYATAEVYTPEPYGGITITENGEYDVEEYSTASVNITAEYLKYYTREMTSYESSDVTKIGAYAFASLPFLSYVSTPNALAIEGEAFYLCSQLQCVYAPLATEIGSYAFSGCRSLSEAIFPNVQTVGGTAFENCWALETVYMPSCTSLQTGGIFRSNSSLKSVNLDACVNVPPQAFQNCKALSVISLPNVSSLWTGTFSGCVNLVSVYLLGSRVCPLSSYVFASTPIGGYSAVAGQYGSVYVPASLLSKYQSATFWSSYSSRIVGV